MFITYVIISLSFDRRIRDGLSYFVDVRDGHRDGRQMTVRSTETHAEALAFVDRLRDAAPASGKEIQFIVDDQAGRFEAAERARVTA